MSERRVFDEVEVKRLRIVDDNGVRRMELSCPPMPEATFRGEVMIEAKRPQAGILFFTEEGTECGGLTFSGKTDKRISAGSILTFDAYEQDQVVVLQQNQRGEDRSAGFRMFDRPYTPIIELVRRYVRIPRWRLIAMLLLSAKERKRMKEGQAARMFLHRRNDGAAGLELMDSAGRPRIRVLVDDAGGPRMEFPDARRNVTHRVPPKR